MSNKKIKYFSDLTRFEESVILDLWNNPYVVVEDIEEVDGKDRKSPLIIKTFRIYKKHKPEEYRNIYFPYSQKLNTILKISSKWLSSIYKVPNSVHGFVSKRGIKTNAEPHINTQLLLKLDLKNFYEQIKLDRIITSLNGLGLDEDLSKLVAEICTVDGSLIQGFSTSPVISNIVTFDLDVLLEKYSKDNNLNFTRYADDMSFSTNDKEIDISPIEQIIEGYGYEINTDKTRILKRGFQQSVTGLTIFDSIQPRIPKRTKRNLRLEVHYIKEYGIKNHAIRRLVKKGDYNNNPKADEELRKEIEITRNRIEGWINFSKGIEPDFSAKLKADFDARNE